MGDIADAMLDGTLCEQCGVLVDESTEAPGYPRSCGDCDRRILEAYDKALRSAHEARRSAHASSPPRSPFGTQSPGKWVTIAASIKVICPECGKRVTAGGLSQHAQMKHPQVMIATMEVNP